MAMSTDQSYSLGNENADTNYSPVMSRDVAVRGIKVTVEKDVTVNQSQRVIKTEDTIDNDMTNRQTSHLYVAIDEIKVEFDDAVDQDITCHENISTDHRTSSDVVCGSTATKDFVTDIKIEIIKETNTPEECTNIETMCRSKYLSNVDGNCGVMNQDGASETATNTNGERGKVLSGGDYSPVTGLPLAETIRNVESSDTAVRQETKLPDDSTRLIYRTKARSGEEPYPCDICNKAFKIKRYLVQHMKIHSGEKLFSCKMCHKAFRSKSTLTSHMRLHTDEKPFSCEICHKRFNQKGALTSHTRTHSGEKPFSCEICHRKFSQKCALTTHARTHSGEKPFSCGICNKAFIQKFNLVQHIMIHREEKPFSCEVCHKTFTLKGSLINHSRTHSEIKPFSCDVCQKTFTIKGSLTSHMRTHSGEKRFSCAVCNKGFNKKSNLTSHARKHSGI